MERRKGVFRMRIHRLYAPSLIGDHTLCYVHKNAAGQSCVNEVPIAVRYSCCGETLTDDNAIQSMTIVLPPNTLINGGDFLAVGDSDLLLRWRASDASFEVIKNGFMSVSAKFEVLRAMTVGVLTVSDKGSRGERTDTAGPELESLIAALGGSVCERKIIPDDKDEIIAAVKNWVHKGYNLVLTTGGTGLSPRDVTPEALLSIAEKEVPGFGEMMRIKTLVHTPRAFLTRSVAVIIGKTLVVAFPGSQRGVRQCFEAISPALRHGVETLSGWDSECGSHSGHHH